MAVIPGLEWHPHPRGEAGAKSSLQKTAMRAASGRLNVRVRAWAIDRIVQAGAPRDKRGQAEAIFEALVREKIYVSDPVDAELIAGAACTLDRCGDLSLNGGDCDDLVVSLVAALESVGIRCAVVAHQYGSTTFEHVLCVCHDGSRWWYLDPAAKLPFGQAKYPAREIWIAVPSLRVLCDRSGPCDMAKIAPDVEAGRPMGDFIGVGSVQELPTQGAFQPISGREVAALQREFAAASDALQRAKDELVVEYRRMRIIRELLGKPLVDAYVYANVPAWTLDHERKLRSLDTAANQAVSYAAKAARGERPIDRDPMTGKTGVVGSEYEPIIYTEQDGSVVLVRGKDARTEDNIPAGFFGPGWPVAAIVIAVTIGAILATTELSSTAKSYISRVKQRDLIQHQDALRKQGLSPEQVQSMMQSLADTAEREANAESRAQKQSPLSELASAVSTGAAALAAIGIVYAGFYAWSQIKGPSAPSVR